MKTQSFAWEIRTLVAQFVDAFNDIVIRRYNEDKTAVDQIQCNFVYAPKQRVLHDLVNKAQHIKLPVIAVWITSIERDQSRVFNKLEGPYYNQGLNGTGFTHPLQPVPVNITMNMAIVTRFQQDMDQIIGNWGCWTDPYIVVSWIEPYTGLEIRSPIHWNGNISLEYPVETRATDFFRQVANTSFKIEGWLYKDPDEPVGKIYKIDTSFTTVSSISFNYNTMLSYENADSTDYFVISGRPTVNLCEPYMTIPCVSNKAYTIYGTMFENLCGLYVSGTPGVFNNETYFDLLTHNAKVSAENPAFSGVKISNYVVNNAGCITFVMPQAVSAGYIDVLALNEAGYGKLTVGAWRTTSNPFTSGTIDYDNYVPYQHPSVSGIYVAPYYYMCN